MTLENKILVNSFIAIQQISPIQLIFSIKAALYEHDLVLWCTEKHASTATLRMQEAKERLSVWAEE